MTTTLFCNHALNFTELRNSFCDASIKVSGKQFHIHRVLFAAHSPYFNALFSNSSFKESELQIDVDVFQKIVDYIYTGKCVVDIADVSNLLKCAHMYEVRGLLRELESYLVASLKARNEVARVPIVELIDSLEHSDIFDLSDLQSVAIGLISDRMKELYSYTSYNELSLCKITLKQIKTILEKPEVLDCSETMLFYIAKAWIEKNNASEEEAKVVLSCVRYAFIPKNKRQKLMKEEPLLKTHIHIVANSLQEAYDSNSTTVRGKEFDSKNAKVGDTVTVMNNHCFVKKMCRDNHLGWADSMTDIIGREVTIKVLDESGRAGVSDSNNRSFTLPFSVLITDD